MANAYEIGVHIAMSGNVAQFLSAMSRELIGVNAKVKEIEHNLGAWKNIIGGAVAAFAGYEILNIGKHLVLAGAELQHFEVQAKAAGYTGKQQADILAAAWKNAGSNINASVSESYKQILELAQVTGSPTEAIRMLPAFTKTDQALASLKDDEVRGKVSGNPRQTYDFARTLELLGVTQ